MTEVYVKQKGVCITPQQIGVFCYLELNDDNAVPYWSCMYAPCGVRDA